MSLSLSEALVKRIIEIADERKIKIPKWSMKAGIPPSTLYGITKGKAGCPKIGTIKLLCDVIDMRLSDFFDCDYIDEAIFDDRKIDL